MNIEWWSRSNEKFTSQTIEGQTSVKQSIWALCIEYWIHWIPYQRYAFLVFDRLHAKMPNKLKYCEGCSLLAGVAGMQKTTHKIFVGFGCVEFIWCLSWTEFQFCIIRSRLIFVDKKNNRSSNAMVSSALGIRIGATTYTRYSMHHSHFFLRLTIMIWMTFSNAIYRTDIKLPQKWTVSSHSKFYWNLFLIFLNFSATKKKIK